MERLINLLLIEPHPEHANQICQVLEKEMRCQVQVCNNGEEASQWLVENQPDLVLVDWYLPYDKNLDELILNWQMRGDYPVVYFKIVEGRQINQTGMMNYILLTPDLIENLPGTLEQILWSWKRQTTSRGSEWFRLSLQDKQTDMSQLIAGMAHEINSPLQVITGLCDVVLRQLEENYQVKEGDVVRRVNTIKRNAWRISEIVRSSVLYARSTERETDFVVLNDLIQTALNNEALLAGWSQIIRTELAAELPQIQGDSYKLTQVLIHLLTNARDVSAPDGVINIRTGYNQNQNIVYFEVEDNGKGISEEVQERMYEPFFTTKPSGKGTGLGLSIVRGIVNSHGGEVQLIKTSPEGTLFRVCLPGRKIS
jgi:signal transduction histidine kinase